MRFMINDFYEVNFPHICASAGSIFLIEAVHNVQWDEITKNLSQTAVALIGVVVMILNYQRENKQRNNRNHNF